MSCKYPYFHWLLGLVLLLLCFLRLKMGQEPNLNCLWGIQRIGTYKKCGPNRSKAYPTWEYIWWKPQLRENSYKLWKKKSSKFTQKIIYIDDMMIHNLIKYLVKTRLCLWDIKIINFYISQTKSSFEKIFYKVVYHHIIYMSNFFGEFRQLFYRDLYGFSRRLWFPSYMFSTYGSAPIISIVTK